jgi:type IV pilus assembly protein PilP
MQLKQSGNVVILILMISCFLWNCGNQKEDSKAPVVSKKISIQNEPKPEKSSVQTPTDASKNKPDLKVKDKHEANVEKPIYDPKERLNPFIALFRTEKKEIVPEKTDKKKKKKRIPQTPLERISLNQLKLVAIIRASSGNKALVEENSGKGYIIRKGTYVGLNSGIVTQINANNVIVEEELENLMGEMILQNTEIKLQKPAGE